MAPMRAASSAAAAAAASINSAGAAPHAVARVLNTSSSTSVNPPHHAHISTTSSNTTDRNDNTTSDSSSPFPPYIPTNPPQAATTPTTTSPSSSQSSSPTSFSSSSAPLAAAAALKMTPGNIAFSAAKTAIAGGLPGAAATGFQISLFMWLQTTVSNQYRSGKPTLTALRSLYNQGGVRRLYSGYSATLLHGTLARFGDTAANAGMLALFESHEETKDLNVLLKTLGASIVAASWRSLLTPIEHFRMNMQTRGKEKGLGNVKRRVGHLGVRSLYHGSMALGLASITQHFPWFCTFNFLNAKVPFREDWGNTFRMVRHGCMGFASSFVSDVTSNFFKIMATIRITSKKKTSYVEAAKRILEKDGVVGLFGRGLKTRIVSNGCQGLVFAIVWKQLEARFFGDYVKEGLGDPYAKQKLRKEREAAALRSKQQQQKQSQQQDGGLQGHSS